MQTCYIQKQNTRQNAMIDAYIVAKWKMKKANT